MEPCSASSQRTGREKAVLPFQRIDRVNDRAPTRLPSSSVKTCKQPSSFCGCCRHGASFRPCRQQIRVAMQYSYMQRLLQHNHDALKRTMTGIQTYACRYSSVLLRLCREHLCSVAAYLLAHSPHILHSLGVRFPTAGCQVHAVLGSKACQGLCWLPVLPISNLQP